MNPRFRRLRALVFGIVIAVVCALLYRTDFVRDLEQRIGLKILFVDLRGPVAAPSDVLVVTIDETPEQLLALRPDLHDCLASVEERAPMWPRCAYTPLIDRLVAYGSAVIVFDVFFAHPSPHPEHDRAIAGAIRRADRVVLLECIGERESCMVRGEADDQQRNQPIASPIDPLAGASRGLAPFPLPAHGLRVDETWAFKLTNQHEAATLPVVALQVSALPLLDALAASMVKSGFVWPQGVPRSATSVANATDLRDVMLLLRRTLSHDPDLRARVADQLSAAADTQLDATNSQLLLALLDIYSAPAEILINYYGPAGTIKTLPASALLSEDKSGTLGETVANNTAVFIGSQSRETPFEFHYSPTYLDYVSGVEVAATVFANMRSNDFIKYIGSNYSTILMLMFGFVTGATCYYLGAVRTGLFVMVWVVGYVSLVKFAFSNYELWLPVFVPVALLVPSTFLLSVIVRDIVPRSKSFPGLCLATDIRESLAIEDLHRHTPTYHRALRKVIWDAGGHVSKAGDDSTMNFWICPRLFWRWLGLHWERILWRDIRCQQACVATLNIQETIREVARRREGRMLETRIGVHFGTVTSVGERLAEVVVIDLQGEVPAMATRLEQLNRHLGTWILASEAAVRDAADHVLSRPIARFRLRHAPRPVMVHEIVAPRAAARPEQLDLCARYGEALELFTREQWTDAAAAYRAILKDYPNDGPTRFMAELSERPTEQGAIGISHDEMGPYIDMRVN